MSGPKTSEYVLTGWQRQNLISQNKCDNSIISCINRVDELQNEAAIVIAQINVYEDCGSDESIAMTISLKEKMEEIEEINNTLSKDFSQFSGYEKSPTIILTEEELNRKKMILKKLNSIKSSYIELLEDITECNKQSKKIKEQISIEVQKNLENVFDLSWEFDDNSSVVSMQTNILSVLNKLLTNTNLSPELIKRVNNAIEKIAQIPNDEFLKNFNAVTIKPLVDDCTVYIENYKKFGLEFTELEAEYKCLCSQVNIEPKQFLLSEDGYKALKKNVELLEAEMFQNIEQEYIADCIDEVMEDMGYILIGNREVVKKSGKRFRDELYTFSEGTAVNIRYDSKGQIAIELGGIDEVDRLPSQGEVDRLTDEMVTFCDKFSEFEERLSQKGILCKNRISHLPAQPEYAQIINTKDYLMNQEVEKIKEEHRRLRKENKIQYHKE